ncbi:serine/threonine-protein phosphatase 6 regulatory ankyrin repeat subunit C-like [Dendronephthya gigantea]|uniref:serine/threonine-protein phosphatase 6 regulatory ankyrin repeat subunit C-like n=1 Tax=Dendronephthya gigantea TaxID=151771 RepID=UPI00106A67CA|nr:serine/threonine-protein phosphatase 6 regulatory ankyrin repeat subunit C-like [Dendronephthya gigantea]XP_028391728.1 serine/threonine-protein phosphatase 6 regulatory ankyrin repeat subunit C-like [Dendronephthya gigantea]
MENLSDGAPKKEDPPPEDETNEKDDNLLSFAKGGNDVEEPYSDDKKDAQESKNECLEVELTTHLFRPEALVSNEAYVYQPDFATVINCSLGATPGQEEPLLPADCVEFVSQQELTPLFEKERVTEQEVYILGEIQSPSSKLNVTLPKKRIPNSDERYINTQIRDAEKQYLMGCTMGIVDEIFKIRCCNIATAIYLDDAHNLRIFLQKDTTDGMKQTLEEKTPKKIKESQFRIEEIQRRILEAVELNSLSCLHVLSEIYEKHPITRKEDIHLFHRRYGLPFWPLSERPKETALHLIANKNSSIKAMEVLQERPKFLDDFSDIPDSHGSSPLLLAIKRNNMEVVKRLLDRKPDVNKRNKHNETPIHVAALNDHADVIEEMLKKYPETELLEVMKNIDGKGHSILYPASQSGKPNVLNLIMEQRWWQQCFDQESKKNGEWESFFSNVCASGCDELAKKCLEQNKDRHKGADLVTPLIRAVKANQGEIVKLILDPKRNDDLFTTRDEHGKNVFHYAVKNPSILCYLLGKLESLGKNTEVINVKDEWENTPIKLAAVGKYEQSFEMLLEHTTNEADLFAAHLIDSVDIEILKLGLLVWREKDRNAVASLLNGDHEKHQPFLEAARKGNVKLMEFFLEQEANHLQRTPEDQTVLHYAVLSGELAVVEFLLEKNEFLEMIDFTDEINISAAGYATKLGKAEILRYLLEKGAQMKSDTKTARLNILDCAYGHFETAEQSIKEIIEFCTTQKKMKHKKTQLLKELFEDSYFGADCIMAQLIKKTADVAIDDF